jgi:methylmalonyl-CoA mutase
MTATSSSKHAVRFVTAAALFDGHDAAINIIRRLLQAHGAEVIHLGHNRSVKEIVDAAIQEDAHGIAVSSYQGGHVEFFRYMIDLLRAGGAGHIKVFGGGGGVIVPEEAAALEAYGVAKVFSPDDGRRLGLDGMIAAMIAACSDVGRETPSVATGPGTETGSVVRGQWSVEAKPERIEFREVARQITLAEAGHPAHQRSLTTDHGPLTTPSPAIDHGPLTTPHSPRPPVVGVTGTGGAGKSSLTDELVRRFLIDCPGRTVAILAVDPTKRRTGGALLGDRIRMNSLGSDRVYMRSLATRQAHRTLSAHMHAAIDVCVDAGFDLVIVESAGAGQADSEIADLADLSVYVMTPEYGAAMQLEKIDMLDFADLVAINKFDRPGALDALRDVRKQLRRCRNDFATADDALPVFPTCAHQFHDRGVNALYLALVSKLSERCNGDWEMGRSCAHPAGHPERHPLIPAERVAYLRGISQTCRKSRERAEALSRVARRLYQLVGARAILSARAGDGDHADLWALFEEVVNGGMGPVSAQRQKGPDKLAPYATPQGGAAAEPASARPHVGAELASAQERSRQAAPLPDLDAEIRRIARELTHDAREMLAMWPKIKADYGRDQFTYTVRDKKITVPLTSVSLSGTHIPKVVLPSTEDWGDILCFLATENVPGAYPYTAGVFPFKRTEELPLRMFAGEGGPDRTNRRFHLVSDSQPFARLSTAFDSVTLYGEDPAERPDIYGKVGESGVSICTVEDMEQLYAGFDLMAPNTSVSMTINGPAPMILAMFFNVAGRQEAKRRLIAAGRLAGSPADALQPVVGGKPWDEIAALLAPGEWDDALACAVQAARGTVQADILKEDQAQNTCIFSTEFALRMMGDIQQWFVANRVRNFYSVSISGYHIAEAGANPISQLAFTLANGFTYVEYYLARGMHIDELAPNLSFFFSNGMDPEYAVIGRVARRIWSTAMRERYGANERSQKLKYHIQTSGRSLHAQEISFNDIRTTLQALLALADNCNSLHTNAYDEAITTPTEESVRRAVAIQLISAMEFGPLKNENMWQGSHFVEWLTDAVEAAVLAEFEHLSERGDVLGAMETGYQRSKIQEESLHYEKLKHDGSYPIVGVNTFLDASRAENVLEAGALTRASADEKNARLAHVRDFQARHATWPVARGPWPEKTPVTSRDRAVESQELSLREGAAAGRADEAIPSHPEDAAQTRHPEEAMREAQGDRRSPTLPEAAPPWQIPSPTALTTLQHSARTGGNVFAALLRTVCSCSLGQITRALYEVGGQYRRSM